MIELIRKISDFLSPIVFVGYTIKGLVGLTAFYGAYKIVIDFFCLKKIELSIGSFKMKRSDINAQNLTNIVSAHFYNGGRIPDEIRNEIIALTMPEIKNLKKNK